jgi:hypothetical protein
MYYRKNKGEKESAVGKPPVDENNVLEADKVLVAENKIPYKGSARDNTSRGGKSVNLQDSTGGFIRRGAATSINNKYKFKYRK